MSDNAAKSTVLDTYQFGRSDQNPDPAPDLHGEVFTTDNFFRGGDTFQNIIRVLDYRFDESKIQQTDGTEHAPNLERPELPEVSGDVNSY